MKKGYKKLIAWEKSDQLAKNVYHQTQNFPTEERFGITNQLRRAALSIPTNIAEGMGRQNKKESKQFINIALGSLAEVEYLLEFSRDLNFLSSEQYISLETIRDQVGKLLWGLLKRLY